MRKIKNKFGNRVDYNFNKIKKALNSAFIAVMGIECPKNVLVYAEFLSEGCKTTEEIQDAVIRAIIHFNYADVAKAYIIYNYNHKTNREFAKQKLDFINNFVNSNNTANATIDDNANVNNHNVAVLNSEIHKQDNQITNMYIWEKWVRNIDETFDIKQMEKDFKSILYAHDSSSQVMMPYCMAVSMYPFLLNGLKDLGGKSAVPKSLESFCGIYINLIFALASEVKGAVATPEVLLYFNRFCEIEWGEDYYLNVDKLISSDIVKNKKTIEQQIDQYLQQIVYSINQVASSRGAQCPFTNFSLFDKYFFEGMFSSFYFPDGTAPHWESFNWLQQHFLHWFNQERLKCMLTFPVVSYACLTENNDFKDKQTKDFICKELAEGNSFFIYNSNSVDSLSSCCFNGDTKIIWRYKNKVNITPFKKLWEFDIKDEIETLYNGEWIKGKVIKLPNRKMYKVVTANNREFIMSDNHINLTLDGEKETKDLTTTDYLEFNNKVLLGTEDNHLSYAFGLLLGLCLTRDTFDKPLLIDKSAYKEIAFNLDVVTWNKYKETLSTLGNFIYKQPTKGGCIVECKDNPIYKFISRWIKYEPSDTLVNNYSLKIECLYQQEKFRRGIIEGLFTAVTDDNHPFFSTKNKDLFTKVEALCVSLGIQTVSYDFVDYKNTPIQCLEIVTKDTFYLKNTDCAAYWKVESIEKIDYNKDIYCFQCSNQNMPYFTLANGLNTHNCRLRNSITSNQFTTTNGQIGIMTGSKNVITLNLNRIIQDCYLNSTGKNKGEKPTSEWVNENKETLKKNIKDSIINILNRVYLYHTAYNDMLHWAYNNNLLNAYKAGFINLDKQYLTIGINGLNQAAEFIGIQCNNNKDYKEFCSFIFSTIKEENTKHKTENTMFNTELVPAESAAIKLYNRDKEDGYWVPTDTNLYASYIFKPNDTEISITDKIILHSTQFANNQLDGGSACHINLSEHLDKEQYEKILQFAAEVGCNYFTFNVPNCECDDCGFIAKKPFARCPKCNSDKVTLYDRVS